ncbi:hypothetical protein PV10_00296 [Exophiala mesophila]|uniref:Heterokaryon incompatibility domain-containing protein n=1 Tax=Exophiala mesophila TaxID=212818 RepID=A0A0D1ZR40_EXOME|nr:uncharacterized protein PV10_00296 [Exophiala mesophila]KIV96424.1 hypothetical protein PV10_00296 [Exophiala mesophila]
MASASRVWPPLPSNDYFRLFILEPSTSHRAPLSGRLEVYPISRCPHYLALSHAWGAANDMAPVFIGGKRHQITTSLQVNIRYLRRSNHTRALWCDSICINQFDGVEKANQIQVMHAVFANADSVNVCLSSDSDTVLRSLEIIQAADKVSDLRRTEIDGKLFGEQHVQTLSTLAREPWWYRLWVIQEFTLGKYVTFQASNQSVDYYTILSFAKKWNAYVKSTAGTKSWFLEDGEVKLDLVMSRIERMQVLRSTFGPIAGENRPRRDRRVSEFFRILSDSRDRQVTDPRDRVYGLLALLDLTFGRDFSIRPDYTLHPGVIYTQFAFEYMRASRSLLLLQQTCQSVNSITSIPSWVPDWTSPYDFGTERSRVMLSRDRPFRASGKKEFDASLIHEHSLVCSAYMFDTVDILGNINEMTFYTTDFLPTLAVIEDWEGLCEDVLGPLNRTRYATGLETVGAAFWRTIVTDRMSPEFQTRPTKLSSALKDELRKHEQVYPKTRLFTSETTAMRNSVGKRRLIFTRQGYIALAPPDTESGDCIFMLAGGNVAYVLRELSQQQPIDVHEDDDVDGDAVMLNHESLRYCYIGDCYVHGIMYGEATENLHDGDWRRIYID